MRKSAGILCDFILNKSHILLKEKINYIEGDLK